MTYTKACPADVKDTPVRAALARVSRGYDVAIEERMTFEIDIPLYSELPVIESRTFGLVWLDDLDDETYWAVKRELL